jgi:Pyruvate/2-oxoacid:ferredoxin oxidoreductase delta subunit
MGEGDGARAGNAIVFTLFGPEFAARTRQCVSCNLCQQFCPVFPQLFALL